MPQSPFPWNLPTGPDLVVETPDGVFVGARHSLYDAKDVPNPIIPGDYDTVKETGED